jgi:S1-C subfamily serine protease
MTGPRERSPVPPPVSGGLNGALDRPVSPPPSVPGVHPGYTSRLPSPPGAGDLGRRVRNLVPLVTAGVVLLALIASAVVQGVLLHHESGRLDRTAQALAENEAAHRRADQEIEQLRRRTATLEARTRGSLDAAAVARQVLPSVFRVSAGAATGSAFAFGARPAGGGTALVTNFHVVEGVVATGGTGVTLQRGNESFTARIGRTDPSRDLAVLETDTVFTPLVAASAEVQPGAPVVVVGSPLGLADSVTAGVVSAVRPGPPGTWEKFIQFDAAISPGNSGGPLVDADGRVVGVAQAKLVREGVEGISIAIPIAEACDGLVRC